MTGRAGRLSVLPLWWRIPAWTALLVLTVLSTHGVAHRVGAGVLMGSSVLALQVLSARPPRWRRALVLGVTLTGLAACYFARDGAAEVSVFLAAGRAPEAFGDAALRWFTVIDTVAVGVTIGIISDSIPAGLAGVGVPLLVQRAIEHQELIRERDRAQALLAEVQAGREAETHAAALRERTRIARDMHDVLAHSLAGLSVQLQAVRAVAARAATGDALLAPLDKAAALARSGLAEARAAVGALRDPGGLGLDALPALVERHPGDATLTVEGDAAGLSPEAGHAVYRAVQESLTNAARYAPGSPVRVTLHRQPKTVEVLIVDSGPAPERTVATGQGTGLGLAGMTERIALAGGSVRAGPAPDGAGWQVALTLPVADDDCASARPPLGQPAEVTE